MSVGCKCVEGEAEVHCKGERILLSRRSHRRSHSLQVSCPSTLFLASPPHKLCIYRTIKQNMSQEQQQQCIEVFKSSYVLKVCGVCQYLLQNAPMIQYKVLVCVFYAVKLTGDQYLTFLFDVYAVHTQVHVNEEDTATDAVKPRDCSQHDQGPVRLRVQSAFIRSKRSVLMLHSALHDVIVIFIACMNFF